MSDMFIVSAAYNTVLVVQVCLRPPDVTSVDYAYTLLLVCIDYAYTLTAPLGLQ